MFYKAPKAWVVGGHWVNTQDCPIAWPLPVPTSVSYVTSLISEEWGERAGFAAAEMWPGIPALLLTSCVIG